jgi:hypothetical protein
LASTKKVTTTSKGVEEVLEIGFGEKTALGV